MKTNVHIRKTICLCRVAALCDHFFANVPSSASRSVTLTDAHRRFRQVMILTLVSLCHLPLADVFRVYNEVNSDITRYVSVRSTSWTVNLRVGLEESPVAARGTRIRPIVFLDSGSRRLRIFLRPVCVGQGKNLSILFAYYPSGEQSCVCLDVTMQCVLMTLVRTKVRALDFKRNPR